MRPGNNSGVNSGVNGDGRGGGGGCCCIGGMGDRAGPKAKAKAEAEAAPEAAGGGGAAAIRKAAAAAAVEERIRVAPRGMEEGGGEDRERKRLGRRFGGWRDGNIRCPSSYLLCISLLTLQ